MLSRARWLQAGLLSLAWALAAPALVADSTIAVVDTQRAVMESEDGLRMQATLKKLFEERQFELDKKQNDLQRERQELDKQRGVLSQDALMQRAEKWQQEVQIVQQRFMEYNQELNRKQNELMQPILQRTLQVVEQVAGTKGYSIVVDKQAVAFARTELDLTNDVIAAYNGGPNAGAASPAAAPAPAPASAPAPAAKR